MNLQTDDILFRVKITKIIGYYYPTAKNAMVREFYGTQGFTKTSEDEKGNTVWEFIIPENYENKNRYISVNGKAVTKK